MEGGGEDRPEGHTGQRSVARRPRELWAGTEQWPVVCITELMKVVFLTCQVELYVWGVLAWSVFLRSIPSFTCDLSTVWTSIERADALTWNIGFRIVLLMRRACCFDGERVSCLLLSVQSVSCFVCLGKG